MTLRKELAAAIHHENFDVTAEGIFFPKQGVMASGEYFDRINGGDWERTPNLIVTEGLAHILSVALGATAKPAGYFLALFSGAAAPAANWTAANFAAAASEIVSMTEGYTSPTRPAWTPPVSPMRRKRGRRLRWWPAPMRLRWAACNCWRIVMDGCARGASRASRRGRKTICCAATRACRVPLAHYLSMA